MLLAIPTALRSQDRNPGPKAGQSRPTIALLSLGHAIDHFVLLIFASSVGAIAADFAMSWEALMPYATGAFLLFGLGAAPAGRLGDLWGRRSMMLVFFSASASRRC